MSDGALRAGAQEMVSGWTGIKRGAEVRSAPGVLRKNLFEPRLLRTLLDPSLYETFWHDINLLAGIVEELNFNARIWTKA